MTSPFRTFMFDCDSTLSRVEGIDEIARGRKDVADLTKAAMDGAVPLDQVYGKRLELVRPSRAELGRVDRELRESKEAADRPKDRAALPLLRETLRLRRERGENIVSATRKRVR